MSNKRKTLVGWVSNLGLEQLECDIINNLFDTKEESIDDVSGKGISHKYVSITITKLPRRKK